MGCLSFGHHGDLGTVVRSRDWMILLWVRWGSASHHGVRRIATTLSATKERGAEPFPWKAFSDAWKKALSESTARRRLTVGPRLVADTIKRLLPLVDEVAFAEAIPVNAEGLARPHRKV